MLAKMVATNVDAQQADRGNPVWPSVFVSDSMSAHRVNSVLNAVVRACLVCGCACLLGKRAQLRGSVGRCSGVGESDMHRHSAKSCSDFYLRSALPMSLCGHCLVCGLHHVGFNVGLASCNMMVLFKGLRPFRRAWAVAGAGALSPAGAILGPSWGYLGAILGCPGATLPLLSFLPISINIFKT